MPVKQNFHFCAQVKQASTATFIHEQTKRARQVKVSFMRKQNKQVQVQVQLLFMSEQNVPIK